MTTTQAHEANSTKNWYQPFGVWLGLLLGFGFASIVAIELTHESWGDICSEFHEPPTTPLGFSVAALAIGVPLVFALSTRLRQVVLFALPAAALEGLVYCWAFTPHGTC